MTEDAHEAQRRAALAWFARLSPVPQAFALRELVDEPAVMAVTGNHMRGIPRDHALGMIMAGEVRRAPEAQPREMGYCGIVVIDPESGWPVQLQTRRL